MGVSAIRFITYEFSSYPPAEHSFQDNGGSVQSLCNTIRAAKLELAPTKSACKLGFRVRCIRRIVHHCSVGCDIECICNRDLLPYHIVVDGHHPLQCKNSSSLPKNLAATVVVLIRPSPDMLSWELAAFRVL